MYQRFFFAFCLGMLLCSSLVTNPILAVKVIQGFPDPESIAINSTEPSIDKNKQDTIKSQPKIELLNDFQYPNGIARAKDGTLYIGSVVSGQDFADCTQWQYKHLFFWK